MIDRYGVGWGHGPGKGKLLRGGWVRGCIQVHGMPHAVCAGVEAGRGCATIKAGSGRGRAGRRYRRGSEQAYRT